MAKKAIFIQCDLNEAASHASGLSIGDCFDVTPGGKTALLLDLKPSCLKDLHMAQIRFTLYSIDLRSRCWDISDDAIKGSELLDILRTSSKSAMLLYNEE